MNILLTNDDGITAPGLWAAAEALNRYGTVQVVAPARNFSGYGAALPPARFIQYFPYARDGAERHPEGVTAFGLDAPPAECVRVGLSGALVRAPIDLVVSGVNDAANLGRDVLYSGTVGAAMTAQVLGVPAVAVSLATRLGAQAHWETAAWAVGAVVDLWRANKEGSPGLFNVNVPNVARSEIAGLFITSLLSRDSCLTRYVFRVDADADYTLAVNLRDDHQPAAPELWTDAWAVANRYVSVTPLGLFSDMLYAVPWPAASATAPATPVFAEVAAG